MVEVLVKAAGELTPEESAQMDETSRLAYAGQQVEDLGWSDSEWFVLGKLDGQVVSMVGVLKRKVMIGEQPVIISGVGSVATHPDFQRRGCAGLLMEQAAVFMRDTLRVPFGLLVCADEKLHYYDKFGWRPLIAPMYFDFQGGKRLFEGPVMILLLTEQPWPQGDVDLQGGPW